MPSFYIPQNLLTFFFGLAAAVSLSLFLAEYRSRQKIVKNLFESSLDQIDKQSRAMVIQAIKKSEQIIAQAEELSTTTISQTQKRVNEIEQQYQRQYALLFEQMGKQMTADLNTQESQFQSYLENLKANSNSFQIKSSALLEQRLNQLIEDFEQKLTDFFTQTQHKSVESIDLEIRSARQLIDAYRQKQLMLIDENIIAVLERTLSLVLTKNLSLKDQVDLVNEALEQAKTEKFIA